MATSVVYESFEFFWVKCLGEKGSKPSPQSDSISELRNGEMRRFWQRERRREKEFYTVRKELQGGNHKLSLTSINAFSERLTIIIRAN